MDPALVRLSKFLARILRHDPAAAGIALDREGWAEVDEILAQNVQPIGRAELEAIVASNPKQRIRSPPAAAVSAPGRAIRCR